MWLAQFSFLSMWIYIYNYIFGGIMLSLIFIGMLVSELSVKVMCMDLFVLIFILQGADQSWMIWGKNTFCDQHVFLSLYGAFVYGPNRSQYPHHNRLHSRLNSEYIFTLNGNLNFFFLTLDKNNGCNNNEFLWH